MSLHWARIVPGIRKGTSGEPSDPGWDVSAKPRRSGNTLTTLSQIDNLIQRSAKQTCRKAEVTRRTTSPVQMNRPIANSA